MAAFTKHARWVGILFLTALLPNILANEMINPMLDDPNWLAILYPSRNSLVLGNVLNILCGIALVLIPVVFFPIIEHTHKIAGIGYIVFRAMEGVLFGYIAIKTFGLIDVSRGHLQSPLNAGVYTAIGEMTRLEIQWATLLYLIVYCCGALLLYWILFTSRIVPRGLSLWGLLGVMLLAMGPLLFLLEVGIFKNGSLMKGMAYFAPPIALNELVLAVWLIGKGVSQGKNIPVR